VVAGACLACAGCVGPTAKLLDNSLRCVDISDLKGPLPLELDNSWEIMSPSEEWERNTLSASREYGWVGYTCVVRNNHGPKPDGRYYLYYAQHEPNSGIGCALAEMIEGPYRKLAELDNSRQDSQVLVNAGKPGEGWHYGSPCVVWNGEKNLWVMYFHFQSNPYAKIGGWDLGYGYQMTALATCPDLEKNVWTPYVDPRYDVMPPGHPALVPVLPTTKELWMKSASSYHPIQRLPDGRWLAGLNATGWDSAAAGGGSLADPRYGYRIGFATSKDGYQWDNFPDNPILHPDDGRGGRKGWYRIHFVGYLGNGEYLVVWSDCESGASDMKVNYSRTRDFRTITRDSRGYAKWTLGDNIITPVREGNKLYLFGGTRAAVMTLPVTSPEEPRGRGSGGKALSLETPTPRPGPGAR
jgi:hypothetical protein